MPHNYFYFHKIKIKSMKRLEFIKKASIAFGAINLARIGNNISNKDEELKFISKYMDKYVDFTDIPDSLDLTERALTAYIRGELSKAAAIKILMFTEGDTEEEALFEIENLNYANS